MSARTKATVRLPRTSVEIGDLLRVVGVTMTNATEDDAWDVEARVDVVRDSLDASWAEAEAARPEGWFIGVESGWPISAEQPDGYRAVASRDQAYLFDGPSASGEGPTPAAALRALAAKLREHWGDD